MTEQTPSQQNDRKGARQLVATFYREIGISAVAAAVQPVRKKSADAFTIKAPGALPIMAQQESCAIQP